MSLADDMRYKGWANWQTHDLYLWLCNDDRTTLPTPPGADINFSSSEIPASPEGLRDMVYAVFQKLQQEYFVDRHIAEIVEADWQELAAAFRDKQA